MYSAFHHQNSKPSLMEFCNNVIMYVTIIFWLNTQVTPNEQHTIFIIAGYKYVFEPNPNRDICSQSRFQPFIFNTTGYSDCVFLKSLCNSEGLKTHEDGTTRSDKTCTCNTEKGFNFVGNPTNKCFCNPSSEDCSCFHSSNSNNRNISLTGKVN